MNKFSNELVMFAGNQMTAYEKFADYYKHYSAETLKKNIGSYDTSVSFAEKETKMNETMFAEIERISGQTRPVGMSAEMWASNPSFKWATFAVVTAMIETILPQTVIDSIGLYTDMRFIGFGDAAQFEVPARALFTVSTGANAQRTSMIQKQFKANVAVPVYNHVVTTQVDLYAVLAGRQSLAEFARKAVLSIETAMSVEAYNAISTGLAATAQPTALKYSGAFDMQKLITMAQTVSAYNFGSKAIVAGTAVGLMNVLPNSADGYRINVRGDGDKIELIRNVYGFDLMVLPQVATGNYTNYGLALSDAQMFVISPASDKLVRGVIEGSTLTNSNDYYETANLVSNFTINKRYGFEFVSGAVGGSYTVTA